VIRDRLRRVEQACLDLAITDQHVTFDHVAARLRSRRRARKITSCPATPNPTRRTRPPSPMNTPGAAAHHRGWSVNRTESTASNAQLRANASTTAPVRTSSVDSISGGGHEDHGEGQPCPRDQRSRVWVTSMSVIGAFSGVSRRRARPERVHFAVAIDQPVPLAGFGGGHGDDVVHAHPKIGQGP